MPDRLARRRWFYLPWWSYVRVPADSKPDPPSCACSCIGALLALLFLGAFIPLFVSLWWAIFLTWPVHTVISTVTIGLWLVYKHTATAAATVAAARDIDL